MLFDSYDDCSMWGQMKLLHVEIHSSHSKWDMTFGKWSECVKSMQPHCKLPPFHFEAHYMYQSAQFQVNDFPCTINIHILNPICKTFHFSLQPPKAQVFIKPPMKDKQVWTGYPSFDRYLHIRVYKPEGLDCRELRCALTCGKQKFKTGVLDAEVKLSCTLSKWDLCAV